jgi:hypothetical protein
LLDKIERTASKVWSCTKQAAFGDLIGLGVKNIVTSVLFPVPLNPLRGALISATLGMELRSCSKSLSTYVLNNIRTGLVGGAGAVVLALTIKALTKYLGISTIGLDAQKENEHFEACANYSLNKIVLAAGWEESWYRGFQLSLLKFGAEKFLPKKELALFPNGQMQVAALVSIVGQALVFGSAHLSNGTGITQFLYTSLGGILFGVIREEEGLLSSIVAHVTANFVGLKVL